MFEMPTNEIANRLDRLNASAADLNLDGVAVFWAHNVTYLSGFAFIPTERPIVLVSNAGGQTTLIVPRLEREHADKMSFVDSVATYDEYPGDRHPMHTVADVVADMGLAGAGRRLGVDANGYPPLWGYWGPPLSQVVESQLVSITRKLDHVMMVKSEYEIGLMRESCRWAFRAHCLLQNYTKAGATETEVSQRASAEATQELSLAVPGYVAGQGASGARAGYRGQIGARSRLPHSLGANIVFQEGNTLVSGATAPMWGYVSELERTMFVGEPSREQRLLFGHMSVLQDIALENIRPGITAGDVDRAVRERYENHGLWGYWRHHVGHGLGLRYHEGPFLDMGDETVLEPGMILAVEPGLYDRIWGGFRHSDTVLVTQDGCEVLTVDYPRDIESLIIPPGGVEGPLPCG